MILANPKSLELIISEQTHYFDSDKKIKYYIPTSISEADLDKLTISYINSQSADNFVLLILENSLDKTDFYDDQIESIDYLIEKEIIRITSGEIVFTNKNKLSVFRDIFKYGGISYHHRNKSEQFIIDQMIADGGLASVDSLFSKCEQHFLNYLLNDLEFDNGPSVRNKYIHSSTTSLKENEHKYNYYLILLVLILIVIKINDDLCIYYDNNLNKDISSNS